MDLSAERMSGTLRCAAIAAAAFVAAMPGTAIAGGYDVGERDWDFLFQQKQIAFESGVTYFNPQRRLTNITGMLGPAPDNNETEAFSVHRFSLAIHPYDPLRCMASYREPWGGHADYGSWTYSPSAVEQHFNSEDYGLTCAVSTPLEKGQLSFLGGYSWQSIHYVLTQNISGFGARTDVSDEGHGWRIGVAYEIPEYALRASLIYNSQVDYALTGTVVNTFPLASFDGPVFGSISMPQTVEFKFQSGVAPGWLAFGAVKWADWSVAQNTPLCPVGVPTCTMAVAPSALTLLWKDTWTVTLGAAHQFFEGFSVAGHVTWDQGATQGFTSQTDTWAAGLTAVFNPSEHVELKFGGTAGILTGGALSTMTLPVIGPNPVGYTADFGDDFVYTLNASIAFRF